MDENTLDEVQETVVESQNEEVEAEVVEDVESEVVADTQEEAEKVVQTPEENSKFAEQRRKYEAEKVVAEAQAQDALIEKMYGKTHGIKTVAEYEAAMEKQTRQAEIDAIKQEKNYSDEDAKEVFEARRIKEERQKEMESQNQKASEKAEVDRQNQDFLSFFKEENGRDYDAKTDKIPEEVWSAVAKGTQLKYAYMEHELKQLKLGTKVADKNLENSEVALGSVKSDGVTDSPLTAEQIESMSPKELMSRWDEVRKVTGMI